MPIRALLLCTSQPRSVYFQSDSAFGDPLDWSGATTPPALATNRVPNLRLSRGHTVTMTPTNTGSFVDGVWSGHLTILEPGVFIFLAVSACPASISFAKRSIACVSTLASCCPANC